MSVQEGPTFKRYVANGVTTVFAIPFLLLDAGDLVVTLDDVQITSGFTLTGIGEPSSTATFASAPTGDLLFRLVVPFQRLFDYQENGDFLAGTVNDDFDRIWQALKELRRYDDRTLRVSDLEPEGLPDLPSVDDRIGKLLSFDAFGNPIAIAADSQSATELALLLSNGTSSVVDAPVVGFKSPMASSIRRSIDGIFQESLSILNWIPQAEHAAILDRTTTFDCGPAMRAAVFDVAEGTAIHFPYGLYPASKAAPGDAEVVSINKTGVKFVGDGELIRQENNTGYFIRIAADDAGLYGLTINGNRGGTGIPDSPGFGASVRSVGFVRGTVKGCRMINSAGQAIGVGAGCNYWRVEGNYFENFYSTAIQFAAEKTDIKGCNFNLIVGNYIKGDLPSVMRFCNGIFVTTSATTEAHDTHFCDGNVIIGNIVEDVPDTGIESGYKCRYSLIEGNQVRRSFNSNILARDNRHSVITGNSIFCRSGHGSSFKHGIYVDGFSIAGDTAPVTTAYCTVANNNVVGAEDGGLSVIAAEHSTVRGNTVLGISTSNGSSGINVKSGKCIVSGNLAHTFQFLYRLSLESSRPLSNILGDTQVKDNRGVSGQHGIMLDATVAMALNNCDVVGNRFESCSVATVGLSSTPTYFNTRIYDNIDSANPHRTLSTQAATAGILQTKGIERNNAGVQFGEVTAFDKYVSGLVVVRMGNEAAMFKVDADGIVTAISESTNIGVAGGAKVYRLEANAGIYVIKRYGASQLYTTFKASLL